MKDDLYGATRKDKQEPYWKSILINTPYYKISDYWLDALADWTDMLFISTTLIFYGR